MNLKKLRNENNLTLDQLSKEVEISNPLLSNYEQGNMLSEIKYATILSSISKSVTSLIISLSHLHYYTRNKIINQVFL